MSILPIRLTQVNEPRSQRAQNSRLRQAVEPPQRQLEAFPMFSAARAVVLRSLWMLAVLALAACAAQPPLQIGEVVTRSKQGQSPDQVVGAVKSARTTYALRGSDFGKLKQAGVADPVLDYLQQSFINDVDLLTRYWVLGESVGGCERCVPQQVDYTGDTPTQVPTRTGYYGFGPQGMPDWYQPYSATRGSFTAGRIAEMTRLGASEAEMIAVVRGGNLDPVIGVESPLSGVRTHPVAALPGSELARMREQGVPDAVLDELQARYLGQFVEVQRLRYQNRGKGPAWGSL